MRDRKETSQTLRRWNVTIPVPAAAERSTRKKELISKIDHLTGIAEGIPLADDCSCQKTAEKCFIPGCTQVRSRRVAKGAHGSLMHGSR